MYDATDYIDLLYTVGGTTYPLTVKLYRPNKCDWADIETASITLQGTDGPDLFDLFEAIRLPSIHPDNPKWYFRTAADEIADRAIAHLGG